MSSSSRKQKKPSQSPPLDRYYKDVCDYCRLADERCKPGSLRETNCILAAILEQLKVKDLERGE